MAEYKQIRLNPEVRGLLDDYKMQGESYSIAIGRLFKENERLNKFYERRAFLQNIRMESQNLGMEIDLGDVLIAFDEIIPHFDGHLLTVRIEDNDCLVFYPESEIEFGLDDKIEENDSPLHVSRPYMRANDTYIRFDKENGFEWRASYINGEYLIKETESIYPVIKAIMQFRGDLDDEFSGDIRFKSANLGNLTVYFEAYYQEEEFPQWSVKEKSIEVFEGTDIEFEEIELSDLSD